MLFFRRWGLPFVMLGPFTLLIAIFFFVPVILITILAFTNMDSSMQWTFNGLANFKRLFHDPNLLEILNHTLVYVFFTLFINVVFALILAIITTYFIQKESVSLFIRTVWMLPRMSPPVVYVLLWLWFLDSSSYGVLNSIRSLMHLEPKAWLTTHPMLVVILANGIIGASYGMIIFSSAIKSIPQDLYQAAKVDGASIWSIIGEIIIPSLRWPIMFVTMWQLLSLLTSYEYILLLTKGGPLHESEVLSLYSFHNAFQNFEFGYGSAVALVLVVIALMFSFILWKVFGMNKMVKNSRVD
ncbi:carbohydrate ABC transporter permease [Ectobacillus panaciterrae]|uniref:carbohydrate ABC transporter permease n=1 Tax=Ectobacillus panaciterrae TaxID=363872 RepID=UPI0003FF7391|nr:sugar ABC transporter permease [Ectobacillus panaciterrae]